MQLYILLLTALIQSSIELGLYLF